MEEGQYLLEFKMNEKYEYVITLKHPLLDDQVIKVFKHRHGFWAHAYYYFILPRKLQKHGLKAFGKREFYTGG